MGLLRKFIVVFLVLMGGVVAAATTNMALDLPVVGTTLGPNWASMLNTAITTIDAHDHSTGKGVPIGVNGINIAGTLQCNSNHVSEIKSLRMDSLGAALTGGSDIRALYVVGDDLYYNTGAGTAVKITSGGSLNVAVAGGFSGDYIAAGASAIYTDATKLYTFRQPDGSAANIRTKDNTIYDTTPALAFSDSTATEDDYQVLVDGNTLQLNTDTNDDGTYEIANIVNVDGANSAIGIGVAPTSIGGAKASLTVTRPTGKWGLAIQAASSQDADMILSRPSNSADQRIVQQRLTSSGLYQLRAMTDAGASAFDLLSASAANGNVAIGASTPDAGTRLLVSSSEEWPVASRMTNTTATTTRGTIQTARGRGTAVSPAAVTSGDYLGGVSIGGHDGTAWTKGYNGGAEVIGFAGQDWASTAHGAGLSFLVTTNGSLSSTEKMRLDQAGNLGIGVTPTSRLHVGGFTDQFPAAIQVDASAHATSRRAAIGLGGWVVLQDSGGVGTKDFSLYDGNLSASRLLINTSGQLIPGSSSQSLGSSGTPWPNVYATTFNGPSPSAYQFATQTAVYYFSPYDAQCSATGQPTSNGSVLAPNGPCFLPLLLPDSGTLTGWDAKVKQVALGTGFVSVQLFKKTWASAVTASLTAVGAASTATNVVSSDVTHSVSGLTEAIDSTAEYVLRISVTDNSDFDIGNYRATVSISSFPHRWH